MTISEHEQNRASQLESLSIADLEATRQYFTALLFNDWAMNERHEEIPSIEANIKLIGIAIERKFNRIAPVELIDEDGRKSQE